MEIRTDLNSQGCYEDEIERGQEMSIIITADADTALLCAKLPPSAPYVLIHLILAIILWGWPSVTCILQVEKLRL